MEVCEHVGTSRMILGAVEVISKKCSVVLGELVRSVLKCLFQVKYGSYFCFSDCCTHYYSAISQAAGLTAIIFRAADFIIWQLHICHLSSMGSAQALCTC